MYFPLQGQNKQLCDGLPADDAAHKLWSTLHISQQLEKIDTIDNMLCSFYIDIISNPFHS